MKSLMIILAAGVISTAAPAFADSASVTTQQTIQTNGTISPPIATAPVEKHSFDSHSVTKSDDEVKRTDEHKEEAVTPFGTSKSTTKSTVQESN